MLGFPHPLLLCPCDSYQLDLQTKHRGPDRHTTTSFAGFASGGTLTVLAFRGLDDKLREGEPLLEVSKTEATLGSQALSGQPMVIAPTSDGEPPNPFATRDKLDPTSAPSSLSVLDMTFLSSREEETEREQGYPYACRLALVAHEDEENVEDNNEDHRCCRAEVSIRVYRWDGISGHSLEPENWCAS